MSKEKAEVDVIRQIFPVNHNGEFVEVGPWPEVPGFVHLRTTGKNKDHFGNLDLSMDPDFAEKIGLALIAAANEAKEAA